MKKKLITVGIIGMFLLTSLATFSTAGVKTGIKTHTLRRSLSTSSLSNGNILYVGGTGPGNYSTIQDAIDVANNGDTVYVYSGRYDENVVVDKSIVLEGKNKENTIIDGSKNYGKDVIYVTANNVEITGFTIQNSGRGDWDAGIGLYSDDNIIYDNIVSSNENGIFVGSFERIPRGNSITNNNISSNGVGILFYNSKDNTVTDNIITSNSWLGIRVTYSTDIKIVNNDIKENDEDGISFWDAHSNTVEENNISHNKHTGIFSWTHSNKGIFRNNKIISNGQDGIFVDQAYEIGNFEITDNEIESNGRNGIRIQFSMFNTVSKNELIGNKYGIYLLGAHRNDIIGNNFTENIAYGVLIYSDYECSNYNNFYYNNFIKNNCNAWDECNNKWYKEKAIEKDEGNYWDDFDDESEGAYDNNSDGIADDPYYILGGNNQDSCPLMKPYGKSESKAVNTVQSDPLKHLLERFPLIRNLLKL